MQSNKEIKFGLTVLGGLTLGGFSFFSISMFKNEQHNHQHDHHYSIQVEVAEAKQSEPQARAVAPLASVPPAYRDEPAPSADPPAQPVASSKPGKTVPTIITDAAGKRLFKDHGYGWKVTQSRKGGKYECRCPHCGDVLYRSEKPLYPVQQIASR